MNVEIRKVLPILACLLFLAWQGMVFRGRVDDPLSFWLTRPQQDELMAYAPRQSPEAESAGPWSALLACRPSAEMRDLARSGLSRVMAARKAYDALLDPLTPSQRAALLVPQSDLVDPLFPGIDASSQTVFFYSVAALSTRAGKAEAVPTGTGQGSATPLTLMPEAVFWRLGRLALVSTSGLTPQQSAQVLQRLRALGQALEGYHETRGRIWTLSALPREERGEGQAPPFPFPTPQELRQATVVLLRLQGSSR